LAFSAGVQAISRAETATPARPAFKFIDIVDLQRVKLKEPSD